MDGLAWELLKYDLLKAGMGLAFLVVLILGVFVAILIQTWLEGR